MSKLDKILDEYHKYLTLRKLAKAEHVPYLVRWVKEFLRFARDKTGHKFETVIEMFRQHLEQNPGITDWQICASGPTAVAANVNSLVTATVPP